MEELLLCSCNSTEHSCIISSIEDEPVIYLNVHLCKQPFFERLKYGIKYIFGYRSKYGDFDEFIFDKSHISQFENIIKQLNK